MCMFLPEGKKKLLDTIGSIHNRCEIAEWILMHNIPPVHFMGWIATLLEDNFEDSQWLMDEYCVDKDQDDCCPQAPESQKTGV